MTERLFVDVFCAVVDRHGARTALVSTEGETCTYAELLDRARRCAAHLLARGVGVGDVVALALPKSIDAVVAMLGAWLARAAFVPIDPALPPARRAFLHDDAGARLTLSPADLRALPDERAHGGPAQADDFAYLIYTSGSSGAPKGVRVAQRGLVPVLEHQIAAFGLAPGKHALLYLSTSFDASISDVGTALLSGATLFLADGGTPAQLLDVLARHAITHADLPPAMLAAIDPTALPPTLETIVIGGEVCPVDVARAFAARVRLVNVYGPTEATICTSLVVCDAAWSRPSIGRPTPGVEYEVVDATMKAVPDGVAGELLIRGRCLALGYLRRPELERAKFVETPRGRAYRTGDRVVRTAGGGCEFLGRVDRQVKVRGQLVEPEEIEACLLRHPAVRRCAVVARAIGGDPSALVAFVVAPQVDESALRAHVLTTLPRFMCPARFERLDALPESVTGKVDLRALAAVELAPRAPADPPRGPRERLLTELFSACLGEDDIGRDDDFFALGGTSLGVLQLVAMAEARGLALSMEAVYQRPTVARLAETADTPAQMSVHVLADDVRHVVIERHHATRATGRDVFVTGATGFLGARVLHALLARDDGRTVTCLVRAPDEQGARRRIAEAIARHGLELQANARLRVVLGDLRRHRFGLDAATFEALSRRTSAAHHLAADVNLVLPYARLRDGHVLGAAHVAALGAPVHHASTLSIFACASPKPSRAREDDLLSDDAALFGGYAQSKYAAERVLHDAATTVRFGLLTGDSATGRAAEHCQLMTFVRGLSQLGVFPEDGAEDLAIDVTPIDWAARAWLALIDRDHGALDARTFHVASPRGVRLSELVAAMLAHGVALRPVSKHELRARLVEAEMDRTIATTVLAACRRLFDGGDRHTAGDVFLATGITFDTTRADHELAACGLVAPTIDRPLLARYLTAALGAP